MSKALAAVAFDYEGIDKDTKGMLVSLAGDFNRAMRDHANSGMEAGKAAAAAHELLVGAGKEGSFAGYAENVLGVSRQTAYNYKWAWERFGKCKSLLHFSAEAMYALASPKAPPEAAKEAEKLVEKGQRVTIAKAKELLDKFREVAAKPRKGNQAAPSAQPAAADPPAKPDPAPEPKSDGPLNDEPEKELSFEDRVKLENGKIESFCRQLMKFYEDGCPKLASVDHLGRYDSALAQVKAACSTLRTCKYHDEPCPVCKGEGCKKCEKESDFGAVTVLTYRQLAG